MNRTAIVRALLGGHANRAPRSKPQVQIQLGGRGVELVPVTRHGPLNQRRGEQFQLISWCV
jgi:hypothetical protein